MSSNRKCFNNDIRNQLINEANNELSQLIGQTTTYFGECRVSPKRGIAKGLAREVETYLINLDGEVFDLMFLTRSENNFKTNFTMEGVNDGQITVNNLLGRITLYQDNKSAKIYNENQLNIFKQDIYDLMCKSIKYKQSKGGQNGK